MILQGKVIIVSDGAGIAEVFGRESDFNYWKFELGFDSKEFDAIFEVEERAVTFSLTLEFNQ